MSFISQLAKQRRLVQLQNAQKGQADEEVKPDLKLPDNKAPGGKPVDKRKQAGLSGMMMRKTVGDLFDAGERLGLSGPLLARHSPTLEQLSGKLQQTKEKLDAKQLAPGTRALIDALPAQLLQILSPALLKLDPGSASSSISQVLDTVVELAESPRPIEAEQVRAIEQIARALTQLNTNNLGTLLSRAAKRIAAKTDPALLLAVTNQLSTSAGKFEQSRAKNALFNAALDLFLDAAEQNKDPAELKDGIPKKGLTDQQVDMLVAEAKSAVAQKQQIGQQIEAAKNQLGQAKQKYEQQLAGGNKEKLEQIQDLRAKADELLSPEGQTAWYQEVTAQIGQSTETVKAVALGQLAFLQQAAPPAIAAGNARQQATNQVTQKLVALSGRVDAESLQALASQHITTQRPEDVPGTLNLVEQMMIRVEQAGAKDAFLGALKEVNLDGLSGIAALANSFGNQLERYQDLNAGPINTLVSTLTQAKEALPQAILRAAQAAADIPNVEGGPIVQLLRDNLPADIRKIVEAKMDVGVLVASYPRVPADATPRLAAIAIDAGLNIDEFFSQLNDYFSHSRGNKDHERNLRSLICTIAVDGGDVPAFVSALESAKMRSPDVCKLAHAINTDTDFAPNKDYIADVTAKLQKKEDVVGEIHGRMQKAVMEKLDLGQLLDGGDVQITDKGLEEVMGPACKKLFSEAAGKAHVNQEVLKGLLIATLGDKVDHYRFTTPVAEVQLACLTEEQKSRWMEPQAMMHIRFEGEGEKVFEDRVSYAAKLATEQLQRLEAAFGKLEDLEKKNDNLVDKLRNVDKNDAAKRLDLIKERLALPHQIKALRWTSTMANMKPETTTPEKFQQMSQQITSFRDFFGAEMVEELLWTIRLSDINFEQVITNDAPDLPTMFGMTTDRNLTGGGCLNWPGSKGEGMAYWTDANKRMIITKNQAGELRRVMLRLIERTDEGHEGEPMLCLEKSYPPAGANQEEKKRLMEHMMRRAADMGIACGFATEYYWDASKTNRFRGKQDADMNAILEDLSKRYGTEIEKREMDVITKAGNTGQEYLDSAQHLGGRGRGNTGIRRWTHDFKEPEIRYNNEFIILQPR